MGNCGENVFQCRKCRHINYENQKGFLCNSCGYCRFATFLIQITAKHSFNVDQIKNEDDQQKIMSMITKLTTSIHENLTKLKEFAQKISLKLNAIEHSQHSILHRQNAANIDEIRKIYMVDCKRMHTNLASNY